MLMKSVFVFAVLLSGWSFTELNSYLPEGAVASGTQGMAYSAHEDSLYSSDTVSIPGQPLWTIRRSFDEGRTWQVLFSYPVKATFWGAGGRDIAFNSKGTGFAIGRTEDPDKQSHWLVLKGEGRDWKIVDDFTYYPAPAEHYAYHIAISPTNDRVCVGGKAYGNIAPNTVEQLWIVRCSDDDGTTWKNVAAEKGRGQVSGVAFDSSGNLFVAGSRERKLRVTKLMSGGNKWEELEWLAFPGGFGGAISAFVDSNDWIYTIGSGWEATPNNTPLRRWFVRRSKDGGKTWKFLDRYFLDSTAYSEAYQMTEDQDGRLFVVGYAMDTKDIYHAIVRVSEDGGESWSTAANEVGKFGLGIYGHNITSSHERVFMSGALYTPGGKRQSILGEVTQK